MSIRDRVQPSTGDEGWTVHADGSLQYKERVVVPQLTDLREGVSLLLICRASRWQEDVPGSSSPVLLEQDEETSRGLCSTMSHMSEG